MLGNAFGDTDNEIQFSLHGFHDGSGGKGRRNIDDGGVGLGISLGFSDGVENRETKVFGATLLRGYATNHVGSVLDGLFRMEGSVLTRYSLADHPRALVHEHRRRWRRR